VIESDAYPALGFDPAPGSPADLLLVAAAWQRLGRVLGDEARGVDGLRQGLLWQGRAAHACVSRLSVVPGDLAAAADACASAGRALTIYAEHLRRAQPVAATLEAEAERQLAAATCSDHATAHAAQERLTATIRRARALRDETEAAAADVRRVLVQASEHAPHSPGWFHRILSDISHDVHVVTTEFHQLVVDIAPTVDAIAGWCSKAASVLAEVGFVVSLVPGAEGLGGMIVVTSIVLSATTVVGNSLLAAGGVGSWMTVAFDGATLVVALASHGMEEPIAAQGEVGAARAAAMPAPWAGMPYMTEREFVLRAVRLQVDGAGAALGTVDLARTGEDWPVLLGRRRIRTAAAAG
jgi:hypothetical protein